ncbi:hypothetical protein DFH09DRAFT_1364735 [Mycena vulgaris]|nr:hypothetical protein DFH09DRAFT_1364735 [Mycena vulgaris]
MVHLLSNVTAATIATTIYRILDFKQQNGFDLASSQCNDFTPVQSFTISPGVANQHWTLALGPAAGLTLIGSSTCNTFLTYPGAGTPSLALRSQLTSRSTPSSLWILMPVRQSTPITAGTWNIVESSSGTYLTAWDQDPAVMSSGSPLTLERENPNDTRQQFWFQVVTAVLLPRLQLLDGDAPPDRSAEFIWLLGVAVPTRFHVAFYAQVWFTHRVGFEPIRDLPGLGALSAVGAPSPAQATPPPPIWTPPPPLPPPIPTYSSSTATSTSTTLSDFTLPPSLGVGGTKGWTSDVGWGCMLRTGQSLFATSFAVLVRLSPGSSFARSLSRTSLDVGDLHELTRLYLGA